MSEIKTNRELAQEISARIGNAPIPFDSVYSICLEIYNELGGEPAEFDSVYSILLETLPLAESIAKKTSITEVDELPDAQDNNNIYRLSSDDKVYMSKHVSTDYTNRLPDEQQIDKAYLYDAGPGHFDYYGALYYKGAYKIICSDGELNGYGWLSETNIDDYWEFYLSTDNAVNVSSGSTAIWYSNEDFEGEINRENHIITTEYSVSDIVDSRTLSESNMIPIPAIYNAPEAGCIGNATFTDDYQGYVTKYSGEEVSYNGSTWYKWIINDVGYYITNKKASEIYGNFEDYWMSDVHIVYFNGDDYIETESYSDVYTIYIPQLNAPDSEQIGKAYVDDDYVSQHSIYTGEETTIEVDEEQLQVYTWRGSNPEYTIYSTKPASEIYTIDRDVDSVHYYIDEGGSISEMTFENEDIITISTVKYQRAIENWEWKQLVTVDDLSSYATKTYVDTNLDLKANKTYVDTNFAKVVSLTQAQYDALATKDAHTLYIITDAQ